MSNRPDLERRIAEKLRNLDAVSAQRLAEDFARLRYPHRFQNLRIFGRNAEGQSTTGWPDAGSELADGRIEAVEATRAHATSWRKHLWEDLEKLKKSSGVVFSGFLFVAVHPDARCDKNERMEWRRRFSALGVPIEAVEIIVGMDLVRDLCEPIFARVRAEILKIEPYPSHFRLVVWTSEHERGGAFEPTRQEFLDKIVHRPAITDQVINRLRDRSWVVVLGSGASGKSILGRLVTLEDEFINLPSYYLDLAAISTFDSKTANEIAFDIVHYGHPGILFIVDNIHLNEDIVHDMYDTWISVSVDQRPWLLLLGRRTKTRRGSRFDGGTADPIILRAREDEVRGVFRRLARRSFSNKGTHENARTSPPTTVVSDWIKEFGGDSIDEETTVDLMALSAAMQRQMDQLLINDWRLTVDHARDEVKEKYLDPLNLAERSNVLRLACMPEDIMLPAVGLPDELQGMRHSVKVGLVFEVVSGRERHLNYRFAHSALARLIMSASVGTVDAPRECLDAARRSSFFGFVLARRFLKEQRIDDAKIALQTAITTGDWIYHYKARLSYLINDLKLLVDQGIVTSDELDGQLSTQLVHLFEIACKSTPNYLAHFFDFAKRNALPGTMASLAKAFEDKPDRLLAAAAYGSLNGLEEFLIRAEEPEFTNLRRTVVGEMEKKKGLLLGLALREPFDHLTTFMRYLVKRRLNVLHAGLLDDLLQPSSIDVLTKRACEEPLNALAVLLDIPVLGNKILAGIERHYIDVLTRRACEEPLHALSALLDIPSLGARIVAGIDREYWDRCRLAETAEQPTFFRSILMKFTSLGRPELGEAPARNQVVGKRAESWDPSTINIVQLTHVLRLAKPSVDETDRFVTLVVTPDWLAREYANAEVGSISGALFWVASRLESAHRVRFIHPSLRTRIEEELRNCSPGWPFNWAEVLSALGAFTAIGGDATGIYALWPEDDVLNQIIAMRSKGPAHERVSTMEFQLWLGLREMAQLSPT